MSNLVPIPFRKDPESYYKMLEDPKYAYAIHSKIWFAEYACLPNKAWSSDNALTVVKVDEESHKACKAFNDDVFNKIQTGRGLYIQGGVGTGKTTWAFRIAIKYMNIMSSRDMTAKPVYYLNVPEFLNEIKSNFGNKSALAKIDSKVKEADLVIFDDIGAENNTPWAEEMIYQYVNYRYSREKSMIFTSNVAVTSLSNGRVVDRILEVNDVITFNGNSHRGRNK